MLFVENEYTERRGAIVGTTVRIKDPMQSIIWCLVVEVDGYTRGLKEHVPGNGVEGFVLLMTLVCNKIPYRPWVLNLSVELRECSRVGRVHTYYGGCGSVKYVADVPGQEC